MTKWKKTALFLALGVMMTSLVSGCGKANVGYVDETRLMKEAPQIKALYDEGEQKIQEEQLNFISLKQNKEGLAKEELDKKLALSKRKIASLEQSYRLQMKQKEDVIFAQIQDEKELDVVVPDKIHFPTGETQPIVHQGGIDVTDEAIQKLQ